MKSEKSLLAILTFLLLVSSTQAVPSTSWGVDVGTTITYWVDEIKLTEFGDANFAALMGDANRTNYVTVTDIGTNSLNYTLGLANGTEIIPDQQVRIDEVDMEGRVFLLPGGSLPLILPLEAGDQSNYLQYLATTVDLINFFVDSLINNDANFSFIDELSVDGIYSSDLMTIEASIVMNNITALIEGTMGAFNMSTEDLPFDPQATTDVEADLSVSYNTTDGTMSEFKLNSWIYTNTTTDTGSEIASSSFNATIVRKDITFLEEVVNELKQKLSTNSDLPFPFLAVLPALFLIRRKKN